MKQHNSLLKLALESEPVEEQKETTVVMNGPLSTIMAKALDVAYAKPDPFTGKSSAENAAGTVSMETQAMDYALAAAAAKMAEEGAPDQSATQSVKVYTYGVGEVIRDEPEPIEVVKQLVNPNIPLDIIMVGKVSENPNAHVNPGYGARTGTVETQDVIVMGDPGYGGPSYSIESVQIVVNYKQIPSQGTVAMEGFKDWVKDFFTWFYKKGDHDKFVQCVKIVEQAAQDVQDPYVVPRSLKPGFIYSLVRKNRFITDLPMEIREEAHRIGLVRVLMADINNSLNGVELDTNPVAIAKKFSAGLHKNHLKAINGLYWLQNTYTYVSKGKPDAVSLDIPEGMAVEEMDVIDSTIRTERGQDGRERLEFDFDGLIDSLDNNHRYKDTIKSVNIALDMDVPAFKSSVKTLVKEYKLLEDELEKFIEHSIRVKKHDEAIVRELVRLGHNVGMLSYYLVNDLTTFFFREL